MSSNTTINNEENSKNKKLIINETVEIFEHSGFIFQVLRKMDFISKDDIINSLSPDQNREMIFKAGESQGKSGSFFFFSHDKKFIIKTLNDSELNTFKKMFKDYYEYFTANP